MPAFPESHLDLLDAPVTASLSTLGADGYPQVTALWFLRDGEVLRTSVLTTRQKYRNAVQHAKVTLFVVDPTNPMRTVEVRADARVDADPDLELLDRLIDHYGQDPATFPAPRDGRVVLTLTPHHVVAQG